jgi:uncharacterized membrane protein YjgN (DUF898 family)
MSSTSLTYPLEFRGNGWEYSKIYFVNLALSILTLGIYSAWAKVRNKRYFYGNTHLAESSFDYHASPIQILKGRLIVVGGFILYNVVVGVVPALSWLFFLLFIIALPWLILKATQFNMRNSSYRQIRFDFLGEMGDLFVCYVLLPVASAFTLWLAYPFAVFKQKQYMADNSRFGQSRFSFSGSSKEFFSTYFTALMGVILLFVFLGFIFGDSAQHFVQGFKEGIAQQQVQQLAPAPAQLPADKPKPDPKVVAKVMLGIMAIYGALLFLGLIVMTYINTRLTNYVFNNLKLDYVRFKVDIGFLRLLWIYLSNTMLILLTFGLFIPWAKVRAVKYKLGCVTVYAADLENYIAGETEQTKAVGEEMSDFLDVDVGF